MIAQKCLFCPARDGAFKEVKRGNESVGQGEALVTEDSNGTEFAHILCAQWVPGAMFDRVADVISLPSDVKLGQAVYHHCANVFSLIT